MKPKRLTLHNFLSHDHSVLDFAKLNSVSLVVGVKDENPDSSNGAGKTAVIEAILYALFEKSRVSDNKSATLAELVRRNSDGKMYVEFVFELDGYEYRITRTRDNNKNKGTCEFDVKVGGKWKSKKKEKKDSTNKEILDTIAVDYKTFISSICFQQEEVDRFVNATSTERKEIVKNILQLDRYSNYKATAKAKLDIIKDELKAIDKYLENHSVNPLELEKKEEEYKKAMSRQKAYETERDSLYKQLEKQREEQILFNDKIEHKKNLEERLRKSRETIEKGQQRQTEALEKQEEYSKLYEQKKEEFKKAEKEYEQLKNKFTVKKEELTNSGKRATKNLKEAEKSLEEAQKVSFSLSGQVESTDKEIIQVQELQENSRCPTCKSDITSSSKESAVKVLEDTKKVLAKRLEKAEESVKTEKAKVDKYKAEVEDLKEQVNEYNQWTKEKNHLKQRLAELKDSGAQAKTIVEDQKSIVKESRSIVKQYEEEVEALQKEYSDINVDTDYFEKLNKQIEEKNKKYEEANHLLTQATLTTGRLETEIKTIKESMETVKEYTSQRENLLKEQFYYTQLVDMFGKEIPTLIIENSCAEIEKEANEILAAISNLSVQILTQQKTRKGDFKETFEIYVQKPSISEPLFIDNLSNGEKFRVVFAIRIALSRLLVRRRGSTPIEFLFYDECFASLDNQGVDQVIDIFAHLQKDFKYQLVITHRADLKERFGDNVIQVKNKDDVSSVA